MKKFEHELDVLRERVAKMGDLVESMVAHAIEALTEPEESSHYERVLAEEERLDQMQLDIDAEAIRLLTVYGPVAHDLRIILVVSRINSELERIGDQTVALCNHLQLMVTKSDTRPLAQFLRMAKVVRAMVHDALKAFRLDDSHRAHTTMASDNLVDTLNDQIIRELLGDGAEQPPPGTRKDVVGSLSQILIAQALERVGDEACNICEQIVYMVEGADIRHSPKHA